MLTEEQVEIQALKERVIRLETKLDMLSQFNQSTNERPLWMSFMIGFMVTLVCIILLGFMVPYSLAFIRPFL